MHDIYQRAQSVQIWLGEPSGQSEGAMKLMPAIQHTYMLHKTIPSTARLDNHDATYPGNLYGLFRLMNRPWFGRIWVIQEVAVRSGNNVHFHCGRSSVTWREFLNAVYCINGNLPMFLLALPWSIARISAFGAACQSEEYNNVRTNILW